MKENNWRNKEILEICSDDDDYADESYYYVLLFHTI